MIERGDEELKTWLAPITGDAKISFDAPPPATEGDTLVLNAHLFEVDRPNTVSSAHAPPLELRLGYLISAWGTNAVDAHALLGRVITAALAQPQYQIEFGQSVTAAWNALARPPAAAIILRMRVTQDRGVAPPPLVRQLPRIDAVATSTLRGRVVAPDGTPIVNAVIEIANLSRSTASNTDGVFAFGGIPRALDVTLHVRAKGHEFDVTRSAKATEDELVISVPV